MHRNPRRQPSPLNFLQYISPQYMMNPQHQLLAILSHIMGSPRAQGHGVLRRPEPVVMQKATLADLKEINFSDSQASILKQGKFNDLAMASDEDIENESAYYLIPTKLATGVVIYDVVTKEFLDGWIQSKGGGATFQHPINTLQQVAVDKLIQINGKDLKDKVAQLWPQPQARVTPSAVQAPFPAVSQSSYSVLTEVQATTLLHAEYEKIVDVMRGNKLTGLDLCRVLGAQTNFANTGMTVLQLIAGTVYNPMADTRMLSLVNMMRFAGVNFNLVGNANNALPQDIRSAANFVTYDSVSGDLIDPFRRLLNPQSSPAQVMIPPVTPVMTSRVTFFSPAASVISREQTVLRDNGFQGAKFQGTVLLLPNTRSLQALQEKLQGALGSNVFRELGVKIERGTRTGQITIQMTPAAKEILIDVLNTPQQSRSRFGRS